MCHNAEMDLEGAGCGNGGAKFSSATRACDTAEGLVNAMMILAIVVNDDLVAR